MPRLLRTIALAAALLSLAPAVASAARVFTITPG
jgi:hypothetical protein